MTQLERNKQVLKKYIPEQAAEIIAEWVYAYDFKLKVNKSRSGRYGDYRSPQKGSNHLITVNHDLNPYAFLITLVHEIAHLTCFNKFKDKVRPHGKEWKTAFKILMQPLLNEHVFPKELLNVVISYLQNPGASSCSDPALFKALKKYDADDGTTVLLEDLPPKAVFTAENRYFVKGEKIRTRFHCVEKGTRKQYLFSSIAEVQPVNEKQLTKY